MYSPVQHQRYSHSTVQSYSTYKCTIYTHAHIHTIHTHTHTHTYTYPHMNRHTWTFVLMYVQIYTCIQLCIHVYTYMYKHIQTSIFTLAIPINFIHKYTCVCVHRSTINTQAYIGIHTTYINLQTHNIRIYTCTCTDADSLYFICKKHTSTHLYINIRTNCADYTAFTL